MGSSRVPGVETPDLILGPLAEFCRAEHNGALVPLYNKKRRLKKVTGRQASKQARDLEGGKLGDQRVSRAGMFGLRSMLANRNQVGKFICYWDMFTDKKQDVTESRVVHRGLSYPMVDNASAKHPGRRPAHTVVCVCRCFSLSCVCPLCVRACVCTGA